MLTIDLSVIPAPLSYCCELGQTNGVPHGLSMTDVFDKFWSQKDHLSSRSIQMGLKYAVEGYIKDFKINLVGNKINLEARVYRSQC